MIEDPGAAPGDPVQPQPAGMPRRAVIGALGVALEGLSVAKALARPASRTVMSARPRPRDDRYEMLEVGPGKRFPSLTLAGCFMNSEQRWNNSYAGADRIARMRFRIIVSPGPPGYYTNDSGSHSRRWKDLVGWPPYEGNLLGPVIIEGEPGKNPPVLDTDGYGDGVLYYQKGLFNVGNFDVTFRNLIFKGFRRRDGYGSYAAVRIGEDFLSAPTNNKIAFEGCDIAGCDNGIMGGSKGQSVEIKGCHIHENGNETGRAHNLYIGNVDSLVVDRLLSTRCTIGHLLKTRAALTTIRNSRLLGGGGTESACLDVPNAGVLDVDNLVCDKSVDSDAHWIIHYSGENQDAAGIPFHNPSSIRLQNVTLLAPPRLRRRPSSRVAGFANQSGAGSQASGAGSRFIPVEARNIRVHGLTADAAGLPCEVLRQRPPLDWRSPLEA